MKPRALIVDDDPEIQRVIRSTLDSLGHTYVVAGSQEAARKHMRAKDITYALLDMEIPEKDSRGFPRIQNGMNLLEEIVNDATRTPLPVIVMTAHGKENPELAVEVLTNGASNWINKPFPLTGRTLDKVIKQTLAKKPVVSEASAGLKPFEGGVFEYSEQSVEFKAVTIAGEKDGTLIRKILDILRQKNKEGRYRAFSGEELAEMTGCEGWQNGIGGAIRDFRKSTARLLEAELKMAVGEEDIIETSGGGYRLSARIIIFDAQAAGNNQEGALVPTVPVAGKNLSKDRQAWIMEQVKRGVPLKLGDITKAFKCSERTAARDTTELKARGLLEFVGTPKDGHYRETAGPARKP